MFRFNKELAFLCVLDLFFQKKFTEAGCDEAGRGCLAGPVVAAAVILHENFVDPGLDDSKKLSPKKREEFAIYIKQNTVWAIGLADNKEIDQINILNASFLAMHRALDSLTQHPEFVIVDGNRFKSWKNKPFATVVKGDGKFLSIAAASILAKTERDRMMEGFALQFPHYGWEKNAGYPTAMHRKAIEVYGVCELHRKSFALFYK